MSSTSYLECWQPRVKRQVEPSKLLEAFMLLLLALNQAVGWQAHWARYRSLGQLVRHGRISMHPEDSLVKSLPRSRATLVGRRSMQTRSQADCVSASRQCRFLRGTARAVEALVLAAWTSVVQRSPKPWLGFSMPLTCLNDLGFGASATPGILLESLRSKALYALHADGSLGPAVSGDEPAEVLAALYDGCAQAVQTIEAMQGLARLLQLTTPPVRIETFDISHLYGSHTVGASAVLHCGVACLQEYACYPISTAAPADDPAAIAEALRARLLDESRDLPDCLLIDGGKAQLSAASAVIAELGLDRQIRLLALAKREEELYTPGRVAPIVLPLTSPTLTLLRRQRDEAHACALFCHRSLRHAHEFASVLDGAGLSTQEQVMLRDHFGSAAALRSASVKALAAVLSRPGAAAATHKAARSQSPKRALNLNEELRGHESAVEALAHSSRRAGKRVEDWAAEMRARRWWEPRRGVRLDAFREFATQKHAQGAVERLLESVAVIAEHGGGNVSNSKLDEALNFWRRPFRQTLKERTLDRPAPDDPSEQNPMLEEQDTSTSADGVGTMSALPGTFRLTSLYEPAGDQPSAIASLVHQVRAGTPRVVLQGATGTGKTFVMAKLIEEVNRPALVIAPNKVLAAQLYTELKDFFPHNSVQFFISHFDFYRPESYTPASQLYAEKASVTNDKIDALRHRATRSLFERRDTIVVATVSCIYGLGMPEEYLEQATLLSVGQEWQQKQLDARLLAMHYAHCETAAVQRGQFVWHERSSSRDGGVRLQRSPGSVGTGTDLRLTIHLVHEARKLEVEFAREQDMQLRVTMMHVMDLDLEHSSAPAPSSIVDGASDIVKSMAAEDASLEIMTDMVLYPTSHYAIGKQGLQRVIQAISDECETRTADLRAEGRHEEAERLSFRVRSDLEQMTQQGFCPGMENYARHLAGRRAGAPPATLIDYMPPDWLLIVDESHITVPQIGGMYAGDRSRKSKLVEHGFRLPSALDNRPLKDEEFWKRVPQALFVSATPGAELEMCGPNPQLVELIARPTGILDPRVEVVDTRELGGWEDHLLAQVEVRKRRGERTLISCLTKRSAEELSTFLSMHGCPAVWMHSDLKAGARLQALDGLRRGEYDVMVGCNLLREGLDLPEVSLVCIMGADKQGFLRSTTSLIQTMGRAARHIDGTCILYTDGKPSAAMKAAIAETERRRKKQLAHNEIHGIIPTAYQLRAEGISGEGPGRSAELLEMLKGKRVDTMPTPVDPPGGALSGADRELYDEIRAWRGGIARAAKRRPFMVLTEATMRGIAVARPTSQAELLAVKGIGPKKVRDYGRSLISLINQCEPSDWSRGDVCST